MLIAILNDTHSGVRNSSEIFIEYQRKFYEEVFFPYCEDHDIKQVIHLGDYYDHRKNVNFKALNSNRRMFLEPLRDKGMMMDIIPGNHDVYHKNTNDLCSLKELLGYYTSNVNIIMNPTSVVYDGCNINLLPWISANNYETSMDFIRKNDGVIMSHLELSGFELMRGVVQTHGMSADIFSHYDQVLSGHYHVASQVGNVRYLGSQMEFTWADSADDKFFHVFDTNTKDIIKVRNPNTLFEKIYYDDTDVDYYKEDVSMYVNKFIKVVVENKNDPFMFDKFIDKLADIETHELKVVENFQEFLGENVITSIEDVDNTTDLMYNYIDGVNTDLDKDKLKTLMNTLYNEALDMDIS